MRTIIHNLSLQFMYKEIIEKIKPELEKVISFLGKELQKVRTERASPALVEGITVDYFGQTFPLRQLAAISTPSPRELLIQPWDKSYTEEIMKALAKNSMGLTPIVDKDAIRIKLPSLSEEFRKDLVRLLSEKQEQSRRTIRKWRDEAWREIQRECKEGKMSEDDKFKGNDKLQEWIEEFSDKVEEMVKSKKKEIEN